MALTQADIQQVLNAIKAESQGVEELETVSSLNGVTSLPGVKGGGLVNVPMTLLQQSATDAAATANEAAQTANTAARTANAAADTATEAKNAANSAAATATEAAGKAQQAATQYESTSRAAMKGATARFNRIVESGTVDISVSVLHQIAQTYGVELTTLMFGDEPKMSSYFVTRKNKGVAVERVKAYKYQSLAAGFAHRKGNPFLVTVHPKPEGTPIYRNTHPGQEFNYVLQGRMLIEVNGKQLILEEGDSIYFDSEQPHGMMALDGEKVCFLAIIL